MLAWLYIVLEKFWPPGIVTLYGSLWDTRRPVIWSRDNPSNNGPVKVFQVQKNLNQAPWKNPWSITQELHGCLVLFV